MAALEQRLDRMERAIDTIAVEVERVAEAHRFTARPLADRVEALPTGRPAVSALERVITPH